MAYTKYSLTPANNNATPPDGAPEGMLPSAVNDTMRDMMAQIRDVGDGIRNGTYTMTAPVITGGSISGVALSGNTLTNPVITGGSINNTPIGASTANTGAFTTLSASGATTFSGATVVSGSLTANTFSSSGATITGGSINSTAIGGSTAAAGAFTTLSASGAFAANGGATLGDASGDALTINSSAVSIPNGLNFDSNTLVIDATNNRVGIGTASPSYALHIAGQSAYLSSGASTALTFIDINSAYGTIRTGIDASGVGYFGSVSNFALALYTNNSERLRIDTSGNVGIGASSIAANTRLLVSGGRTNLVANSDAFALGVGYASAGAYYLGANSANNALIFSNSGGTEVVRFDSSGNVGIGTSSPNTKLQVITASGSDGVEVATASGASRRRVLMTVDGTAGYIDSYNFAGSAGAALSLNPNGGNVGIGTSSPTTRLSVVSGTNAGISVNDGTVNTILYNTSSVNGSIGTTTNHAFAFYTNNSEKMRIDSSGNVGIGTSTPSTGTLNRQLTINSGASSLAGIVLQNNATGTAFNDGFQIYLNGTTGTFSLVENSPMTFEVNGSERMRIDSSGNVGIGTSSPSFKLQVSGDSSFTTSAFAGATTPTTANNERITISNSYDGTIAAKFYSAPATNQKKLNFGWNLATYGSGGSGFMIGGTRGIYSDGAGGTYISSDGTTIFGVLSADGFTNASPTWTERMRIDSDGRVKINSSANNDYLLSVAPKTSQGGVITEASTAGYAAIQGIHSSNSATGYCAYFNNSGSLTGLYISNTAAWQSTSDERLKEDIKDLYTTQKLLQLKPRDYLWKSQKTSDDPNKRNFGFIAQEVQQIFPELVGQSPDGMLSVEYTGLIAPLVKAIQEQQAMIEELKQEVALLKSK